MRGGPRPQGRGAASCRRRCCPAPAAVPRESSGPGTGGTGCKRGTSAELWEPAARSVLGARRGAGGSSRSSSLLGAAVNRLP